MWGVGERAAGMLLIAEHGVVNVRGRGQYWSCRCGCSNGRYHRVTTLETARVRETEHSTASTGILEQKKDELEHVDG